MGCLSANHLKKNSSADVWSVLFVLVYKEGSQGYKFIETQKVLKIKY